MVEVRMRMKKMRDGEAKLFYFSEDTLRRASWIDDDSLLRDGIADD